MTANPALLVAGVRIGRYVLESLLGEGGFGVVFTARDVDLDREVALKFLHAEHTTNPEILRRFLQEARSAAKIAHPGIVTVFECGQVAGDGAAFIAMERLHGESLAGRLARGALAIPTAVEIGRQIASALDAAHAAGIIHRDLKPDNIFMVRDPAMACGERVKILDFGIAKLAHVDSVAATRSQIVFGTPRYMSPEQCRSAAHIDHRSDLYALGCILYELVCGSPPFDGESGELIAKHQLVAPVRARTRQPAIPPYLDALIERLLAKSPADRPQTMAAVQHVLEAGGDAGSAPTLPPDADASFSPPIRTPAPTTLGGESVSRLPSHRPSGLRRAALAIGAVVVLASAGAGLALRDHSASVAAADEPRPTEIAIELRSTPVAEVYLVVDGRLLGETPYRTTRPPTDGSLVFVLKAPGYRDERIAMPADRSGTRDVTLVALPAAATSVPPPTSTTSSTTSSSATSPTPSSRSRTSSPRTMSPGSRSSSPSSTSASTATLADALQSSTSAASPPKSSTPSASASTTSPSSTSASTTSSSTTSSSTTSSSSTTAPSSSSGASGSSGSSRSSGSSTSPTSRCAGVTCAAGFTCRAADGACVVDTIEVYQ